jgi:hypothetical protein
VKQEIGENIVNYLLVKHMRFINSAKPLHQFFGGQPAAPKPERWLPALKPV